MQRTLEAMRPRHRSRGHGCLLRSAEASPIGARAEEYRFARYVEDWRLKIERIGNPNYLQAARDSLYGNLVLTV